MLPQWNIKDSSHSARSAGGRIHLDKHDPLTKRNQNGLTMLSRIIEWTYQENKLACNWSWNAWPQLSQLAEPLLTNHGLKSEISACKLITIRKKCRQGIVCQTFTKNPSTQGKSHHNTWTYKHKHIHAYIIHYSHMCTYMQIDSHTHIHGQCWSQRLAASHLNF